MFLDQTEDKIINYSKFEGVRIDAAGEYALCVFDDYVGTTTQRNIAGYKNEGHANVHWNLYSAIVQIDHRKWQAENCTKMHLMKL